jgi:hypothetical protein
MRSFNNPLAFPDITAFMQALLNVVIVIATPIMVLCIIYAGFLFVTAQGNPEKLQVAKRAIIYGIIGGVIILGSVAVLQIVQNTVNEF